MPPLVALILCCIFIFMLLKKDAKRNPHVSSFLLIPLLWMMLLGSRFVGQWLNYSEFSQLSLIEEGSVIDRVVFSALIFSALVILWKRDLALKNVFSGNRWLILFLFYCMISISWSDFPFVAFKRWVKELGNFLMVLVVVTEDDDFEAIKAMIRRCAYVLIPLSIVLIKYFPDLGRQYSFWTGEALYIGVATSKNMLGCLSLITGLYFVYVLMESLTGDRIVKKYDGLWLVVHIGMLVMILWLLHMSQSATSLLAFMGGSAVLFCGRLPAVRRNPALLFDGVIFVVVLIISLDYIFGIKEVIISYVGRDQTLTGRADLWEDVLSFETNPLFGTGYESFWLGKRLEKLWDKYWWAPTGSHNGYLETYLNLGWIGALLLTSFILEALYRARNNLKSRIEFGAFQLSLIAVVLFYNMTEVAFKGSMLVWFVFIMVNVKRPLGLKRAGSRCR
jgi:exopolysaccharide production protein ExoQ